MVTPNSTPRATPVRSQSVEFTPKSILSDAINSEIKKEVISEEPTTTTNVKKVTESEWIKTEPLSPPQLPIIPVVREKLVSNYNHEKSPLKVEIKEEKVENHQENHENESKNDVPVVPVQSEFKFRKKSIFVGQKTHFFFYIFKSTKIHFLTFSKVQKNIFCYFKNGKKNPFLHQKNV